MNRKVFFLLALILAWCGRDGTRVNAQTRLDASQVKTPSVSVFTCAVPPTPPTTVTNPDGTTTTTIPGSNCSGTFYVDVITPAGTELMLVGVVFPGAVNMANWSLVP